MKCITYGKLVVLFIIISIIAVVGAISFVAVSPALAGIIIAAGSIATTGVGIWWLTSEFSNCKDGFVGKWAPVRQEGAKAL